AHNDGAVAALGFSLVKRLVGDADDFGRREVVTLRRGDANTDGNAGLSLARAHPALPSPLCPAYCKLRLLNNLAHAIEIDKNVFRGLAGKHHRELFPAVAVGFAAAGNARQPRSH